VLVTVVRGVEGGLRNGWSITEERMRAVDEGLWQLNGGLDGTWDFGRGFFCFIISVFDHI